MNKMGKTSAKSTEQQAFGELNDDSRRNNGMEHCEREKSTNIHSHTPTRKKRALAERERALVK